MDESKILSYLPRPLQEEVTAFLNKDAISRIDLFDDCSSIFVKAVTSKFTQVVYLPRDEIAIEREICEFMLIINRGRAEKIEMLDNNGKIEELVMGALCEGSFYGETSFFKGVRHLYTIKAASFCDVSILTRQDFKSVTDEYPGSLQMVEEKAKELDKYYGKLRDSIHKNMLKYKAHAMHEPGKSLYPPKRHGKNIILPTSLAYQMWNIL